MTSGVLTGGVENTSPVSFARTWSHTEVVDTYREDQ